MQPVLEGLYEIPGSMASYDFNDIDADVLGAVYEQYLGHVAEVIKRRAKELQSKMELGLETPSYTMSDKKEHRKEQGIYYSRNLLLIILLKGLWELSCRIMPTTPIKYITLKSLTFAILIVPYGCMGKDLTRVFTIAKCLAM